MKRLVFNLKHFYALTIILTTLLPVRYGFSQVPIPTTYPPNGNIYPWGYQIKGTNWNTSSFIPLIYNRQPFRMRLPAGVTYNSATNTFSNPTGQKFPSMLFLHGLGEVGTENGYQLKNCAQAWMNAAIAGKYNGFLIFPQNFTEFWGPGQQEILMALLNNLVDKGLVDPFKMTINGLSSGGHGVWTTTYFNPKMIAGAVPMSAANVATIDYIPEFVHIPIWESQGGKDTRPHPGTAIALRDAILAAGGDIKLTIYDDLGHGTWDRLMTEPDFFPFFVRANKTNPHVFFNRTEFCAEDVINVKLGLTAGFEAYQWRKDGVVIEDATTNEITVTSLGVYDARIKRNGVWSYWSPLPVQIKIKAPTVTPPIQTADATTVVIPDPNGNSNITLKLPDGYQSYRWEKVGSSAVIGTNSTLVVNTPGSYVATVTELYGCSSNYSTPFKIVDGAGAGAPPAPINFNGYSRSQTEIQLNWSQNPTPTYNETGFEIYRSLTPGGPYSLIYKTAPDVTSYINTNLSEKTNYYYLIRAVNDNGASASSPEVSIATQADIEAPTAPLNLRVVYTMSNYASITWDASTDNVNVYRYDVYRNGVKVLVSDVPSATVFNLTENQAYNFSVKARDFAGNESAFSNQITVAPVPNGLDYKYYEGTWTTLPDFNGLSPLKTGHSANIDLTPKNKITGIAFYWEGEIVIPVAGNYTFQTRSSDGSKLYIGGYDESKLLINNDGIHGATTKEATYNFPAAGTYPIVITYFRGASGSSNTMLLYWRNTASGVGSTAVAIPNSAFIGSYQMPGSAPNAPRNLTATPISYNQINLAWSDNSSNENGFQIFRSTSSLGTYYSVGVTGSNTTTFSDNTVKPNTTYFYKVQAIGQYGQSGFNSEIPRGFTYSYYEADFTSCPPIEAATPKTTGFSDTFDLAPKQKTTYFAFKWEGLIIIPTTGTYTFYLKADDGSALYINGASVVIQDSNTNEKSGTVTLNQGVYPIKVLYRQRSGSYSFVVSYQGPGISKVVIPNSAFRGTEVSATSLPLPPKPASPSTLVATTLSTSQINLSFKDNSSDETGFIVYRSTGNNTSYTSVATLPSNATGTVLYSDVNLFTNVTYYYKVVAVNVGGESAASNESNAKTLDHAPAIEGLSSKVMRWGTQVDVNIFASDEDAETLTLTAQNLPSFATITDYGDGTGLLSFAPAQSDMGTYSIIVRVDDQNGGFDTGTFTLTVDSNFTPDWAPVANQIMDEAQSLTIPISATDQDGDALVIHAYNVPSFGVFTDNGNGSGTLAFNPQFGKYGDYFINLEAIDTKGSASYQTIKLTVNEVKVNYRVLVNFNSTSSTNTPTPWNNTTATPVAGMQFLNLVDDKSSATEIDLTLVTAWGPQYSGIGDFGVVTGNNSGAYPDNVMKSYYYTSDNNNKTIKYSGLNSALKYSFVFFGSRNDGSNRITQYSIGAQTVSLDCANNAQNVVRIEGVSADVNGEISINIKKASATAYGYLNAMEVIAYYDDGQAPIAPTAMSATNNPDGSTYFTWIDNSASESSFNIYRAINSGGPYTLLKTVSANITNYTDNQGLQSLVTYYYKIASVNTRGSSESNIVSVTIPNKAPVIAPISAQDVLQNKVLDIAVVATDLENDAVTLSATNLPSFVTFTDNGNSTGTLEASPQLGDKGVYTIQLTATDSYNNFSAPVTVKLTVVEILTTKVLVNVNDTRYPVGAPWNSFNTTPTAGKVLSNLKDINNNDTGISLTILDAWTGGNIYGKVTGDNSGIFPDDVNRTFYYYSSSAARRIKVSGLQINKTYNFSFFASRDGSGDRTTNYTIGTITASLNASDNISQTANINGQKSDANGEIVINIQKSASSQFAFLNALVIESYDDDGLPLSPSNLGAKATSRNSVEVTWQDNSSNETGFELYRSASSNGPFVLVSTIAANSPKYVDGGLSANTRYFYKIRSINAVGNSAYTSVASAITLDYAVYINFDDGRNGIAPAPWNTTARIPIEGDVWTNLKNDAAQSTGINMTLVQNFSGSNPFGMNTGNNSGIFPDLVIQSFYYNEVGIVARLKFSGLAPSYAYNLVYFTSRNGSGNRSTDFTVNGQTVTTNASYNISSTVQHTGVSPDVNGEITVDIKSGTGSVYAYLNAMVLQAYLDPNAPNNGRQVAEVESQFNSVSVYPNPLQSDKLYLEFEPIEHQDLNISMISTAGVEIYRTASYIDSEKNTVELDLTNRNIEKGMYLIRVSSSKMSKVLKVIKE